MGSRSKQAMKVAKRVKRLRTFFEERNILRRQALRIPAYDYATSKYTEGKVNGWFKRIASRPKRDSVSWQQIDNSKNIKFMPRAHVGGSV